MNVFLGQSDRQTVWCNYRYFIGSPCSNFELQRPYCCNHHAKPFSIESCTDPQYRLCPNKWNVNKLFVNKLWGMMAIPSWYWCLVSITMDSGSILKPATVCPFSVANTSYCYPYAPFSWKARPSRTYPKIQIKSETWTAYL